MKRAIVISVRESKDNKTNENNAWVTVALMPTKMKNGNVFFPKSSEICVSTCAGELRSPDKFSAFRKLKLGDVVDVHYGFNEFSGKTFVENIELVTNSPFDVSVLIV